MCLMTVKFMEQMWSPYSNKKTVYTLMVSRCLSAMLLIIHDTLTVVFH